MTRSLYTGPTAISLANEGNDTVALCTQVKTYAIAGQADLDELATAAREAKTRLDFLTNALAALTGPLRAQEKEHRERYRPALDAYGSLLAAIKERLGRHVEDTRALAAQAQQTAAEHFVSGHTQAGALALAQAPPPPAMAGISTHTVWKFEIINGNMVPREYCKADEVAIRAAVHVAGVRVIPGVRIWQEEQVSVRK